MKVQATVESIIPHGDSVYAVHMRCARGPTHVEPGQFTHVALDVYDPKGGFWPESRVFSIASYDGNDKIEICYSVKGRYTKRMQRELTVGKQVWLKLPYGSFVVPELGAGCNSIALVAGGTGITAFSMYLSDDLNWPTDKEVFLFYGSRDNSTLLYEDAISQRSEKSENFHSYLWVERDPPGGRLQKNQGMVDFEVVRDTLDAHGGRSCVFLSGPPGMVTDFRKQLIESGHPITDIFVDAWE